MRGANTNEDSDSIACIAGSISGAYLGIESIPEVWRQRLENRDYIEKLALSLADKMTCL